ncbi:MAG: valine--tRNA ligase [bacterium]|nr:valine--tRNA ligase [bacterium]
MSNELPKNYNPKETEEKIYKLWEESGFFNPDKLPKRHVEPFSIVLPPPNVTAALHMGSALMLAIQDIMIRFERMRGKKTLWLPGTDHASIATETKFIKDKKINRNDYAEKKDEFINLVNEFALQNQSTIIKQMRTMGASLDWSRLTYTLDKERSEAVQEAFVQMHEAGLIYMGKGKVINWDPKGQTVVSDDEIEYEPGKTTLYTFKYSKDLPIAISTTRPETKVGDTAIAVHPDDKRYKEYIGKVFDFEFAGVKLSLKIVGDPFVDPNFGTGALGVTPAHSIVDSEIASRHNLPSRQVINEYARMSKEAGPLLEGKKTIEAREIIIKYLRDGGLLEKEELVDQNIPKAQRSGGIIEPLPKRHQFFVDVNKPIKSRNNKTLKELMREVIDDGKIKILPERFEKIYLNWIDNLRDWSISRQIWYGHRIPVWYRPPAPQGDEMPDYVVSKIRPPGDGWEQFSDTLDTWFSSGLWTFSTLGWPNQTSDLKTYHPTNVLETAYDILFFWVAKMILMSQFLLEDIPFKTVYLHGLVRDEKNRKISKSLGNNIDPLDMIALYGTDAVRMAMIIGTSVGNDSKVSPEKFKAYKHFANKLWNIARFVLMSLPEEIDTKTPLTPEDKTLLDELDIIIKDMTKDMGNFKFYLAAEKIYHYVWHAFADKILEESKTRLASEDITVKSSAQKMLLEILTISLKLLHPFMPFITEEIYSKLPIKNKQLLLVEEWPAQK